MWDLFYINKLPSPFQKFDCSIKWLKLIFRNGVETTFFQLCSNSCHFFFIGFPAAAAYAAYAGRGYAGYPGFGLPGGIAGYPAGKYSKHCMLAFLAYKYIWYIERNVTFTTTKKIIWFDVSHNYCMPQKSGDWIWKMYKCLTINCISFIWIQCCDFSEMLDDIKRLTLSFLNSKDYFRLKIRQKTGKLNICT